MDDPDGGRGDPLPTLFYGLLPKPPLAAPPPEPEWEPDEQHAAEAERAGERRRS